MSFLEFLDRMANTLDTVEVHGRSNVDSMNACFIAIEQMRASIVNMAQQKPTQEEEKPQEEPVDGGGEDG